LQAAAQSVVTAGAERGYRSVWGVSGIWWGPFYQAYVASESETFAKEFIVLLCLFRHTLGISMSSLSYGWGSCGFKCEPGIQLRLNGWHWVEVQGTF